MKTVVVLVVFLPLIGMELFADSPGWVQGLDAFFKFAVTVLGVWLTYSSAKAARNVETVRTTLVESKKVADEKVETVRTTLVATKAETDAKLDTIRHLVNGGMLIQLEAFATVTQELANIPTATEGHRRAATAAQKALEQHKKDMIKDHMVQAVREDKNRQSEERIQEIKADAVAESSHPRPSGKVGDPEADIPGKGGYG